MNTKEKVGLTLFWIGLAYMVGVGWFAGWSFASAFRGVSLAEVNQTVWALDRPLFWLWAFSVPLGSILAGAGILMRGGSMGSRIWMFAVGMVLVLALMRFVPVGTHYPPVFGIFGGLILGLFILTVWFWAKRRTSLDGPAGMAADFRLVGYVWFIIAMWYLCGALGARYLNALGELDTGSPVPIILYLAFGWLFLFLAQYTEAKSVGEGRGAV
jgi:hypothetical protein